MKCGATVAAKRLRPQRSRRLFRMNWAAATDRPRIWLLYEPVEVDDGFAALIRVAGGRWQLHRDGEIGGCAGTEDAAVDVGAVAGGVVGGLEGTEGLRIVEGAVVAVPPPYRQLDALLKPESDHCWT
jgi:hypothetical protein